MFDLGKFPFGQPVQKVVQTDRTPKRVFILGVYASAVHARWMDKDGKTLVKALAVASEPYIFWKGENAEAIIQNISVPDGLGKLVPAGGQFNGPSGKTLEDYIIEPLGLTRDDTWLCDLAPRSYVNEAQDKAIKEKYQPFAQKDNRLPPATVQGVPSRLTDEVRRSEILKEIQESRASTLILLGDKPFQWFLSYFDKRWSKLADFGHEAEQYGQSHLIELDGKQMNLLPLAHPRQIARLGKSSPKWSKAHAVWMESARKLLER